MADVGRLGASSEVLFSPPAIAELTSRAAPHTAKTRANTPAILPVLPILRIFHSHQRCQFKRGNITAQPKEQVHLICMARIGRPAQTAATNPADLSIYDFCPADRTVAVRKLVSKPECRVHQAHFAGPL